MAVFGGKAALAYYYATVPALADAQGFQPVVRINAYETPCVLPVASNLDFFLDTWARYLERLVSTPGLPTRARMHASGWPWCWKRLERVVPPDAGGQSPPGILRA